MLKGHIISITYNTCLYGSFQSLEFVVKFWVCFEHSTHTPRYSTSTPRFFVSEFWVCFEHSTHTPRCSTPTQRFFVSESWVCLRVLGLFPTFHAHTTMLNAHPTIFCFRVLGLLSSFGFLSNIPRTHHNAQRPPHYFFSEFWFCCRVLAKFANKPKTQTQTQNGGDSSGSTAVWI